MNIEAFKRLTLRTGRKAGLMDAFDTYSPFNAREVERGDGKQAFEQYLAMALVQSQQ